MGSEMCIRDRSKAADSAYSGFLQSYDQELGSKSYGAVVDLLVAYYGGV